MEVAVPQDICYLSSLSFIWYFSTLFVAKSFRYVILRDWEGYWPPRIGVPRRSLSTDTVKVYIGTLYLFLEYSFHFFLCWSSSNTLLSSDWVLGHRPNTYNFNSTFWLTSCHNISCFIGDWLIVMTQLFHNVLRHSYWEAKCPLWPSPKLLQYKSLTLILPPYHIFGLFSSLLKKKKNC